MQRTLALVKPDAYAAGHAGAILAKILLDVRKLLLKCLAPLTQFAQRVTHHTRKGTPIEQMLLGPIRGVAESLEDLHLSAKINDR